jgi:radical SAM superfamily enzyme YgiQ (UPF0313 family)
MVHAWSPRNYPQNNRPRCNNPPTVTHSPFSNVEKVPSKFRMASASRHMSIGEACGLSYAEPVFRPPAEFRSLILQVIIGCSWNRCSFCEMYQDKVFRSRPLEEIESELAQIVEAGGAPHVRDVFLADGDAMALPTGKLLRILQLIRQYLPKVRRISSYCLPRNIRYTSVEDLTTLCENGLSLVYVGCESGNNEVLQAVEKGETFDSSLDALTKLKEAGIKRSVMILLGLGGTALSKPHAIDSARLCSQAEPEFLSVLTTSFPRGKQRVNNGFDGINVPFQELTPRKGLEELELFLSTVDISSAGRTVFRSDHASNYFVLKGRLGRDKKRLLSELRVVLDAPEDEDQYKLRPEWARGL